MTSTDHFFNSNLTLISKRTHHVSDWVPRQRIFVGHLHTDFHCLRGDGHWPSCRQTHWDARLGQAEHLFTSHFDSFCIQHFQWKHRMQHCAASLFGIRFCPVALVILFLAFQCQVAAAATVRWLLWDVPQFPGLTWHHDTMTPWPYHAYQTHRTMASGSSFQLFPPLCWIVSSTREMLRVVRFPQRPLMVWLPLGLKFGILKPTSNVFTCLKLM